jgi:hypothetical protein
MFKEITILTVTTVANKPTARVEWSGFLTFSNGASFM